MKTIALLRGVNVGGHTVMMDRLKALLESMGFTGVSTYIQSGNVLFDGGAELPENLCARLEETLSREFGFAIPVVLVNSEELGRMLAANPFAGRELGEGERVHVTVLAETPAPETIAGLPADPRSRDEFSIVGRAAYILCRDGYHKTAYSNATFEKKLKMKATTRNVETMAKLLELANLQ